MTVASQGTTRVSTAASEDISPTATHDSPPTPNAVLLWFSAMFTLLPPLRLGSRIGRPPRRLTEIWHTRQAFTIHEGRLDLREMKSKMRDSIVEAVKRNTSKDAFVLSLDSSPRSYAADELEYKSDELISRLTEILCVQIQRDCGLSVRVQGFHRAMRVAQEEREVNDASEGREPHCAWQSIADQFASGIRLREQRYG